MYNNEKVKEIQRVKNLSLEEMRAKRLELFTDFHNKRNTAITEVNTKRNEVLTLETDGKTEVSRLVTNTESEIIVDTKHKVDNNETGKTGITEALTNGLNNIKKVLNKYTENHTIPVANKLGNYTASELISKYNARLKLPKKSIVFDYTQGISAYDINEGRYIRPEGYESTLINKGEGIFESVDGKLGGRIILNKGLFVGGKYENLCNHLNGFNYIKCIADISQDKSYYNITSTDLSDNDTRIGIGCWSDSVIAKYKTGDALTTSLYAHTDTRENINYISLRDGDGKYMATHDTAIFKNIKYRSYINHVDKQRTIAFIYFKPELPIGTNINFDLQISTTKSHRPFIKPNYKVPDTNIKYPLYRDYKVIIMKMEKLYPEYDVINLLGDDKFILQVKKDIQSLFTREENNVFIFDKVNKNMYINGIEVSNKLFNYVELHNDLVCWYSHTSYKENYNDKRGRWFDLSSNGNHMDNINNDSCEKLADTIWFNTIDSRSPVGLYSREFTSMNSVTYIIRCKVAIETAKQSPIITLSDTGDRDRVKLEVTLPTTIAAYAISHKDINNVSLSYIYFGDKLSPHTTDTLCYRIGDNTANMYINGEHIRNSITDTNLNIRKIRVGYPDSRYPPNFAISDIVMYKKILTDEEVQIELNKLGW